jgi:hypothetical protein
MPIQSPSYESLGPNELSIRERRVAAAADSDQYCWDPQPKLATVLNEMPFASLRSRKAIGDDPVGAESIEPENCFGKNLVVVCRSHQSRVAPIAPRAEARGSFLL